MSAKFFKYCSYSLQLSEFLRSLLDLEQCFKFTWNKKEYKVRIDLCLIIHFQLGYFDNFKPKSSTIPLSWSFEELPEEIQMHVLSFSKAFDLCTIAQVSKELKRLRYLNRISSCWINFQTFPVKTIPCGVFFYKKSLESSTNHLDERKDKNPARFSTKPNGNGGRANKFCTWLLPLEDRRETIQVKWYISYIVMAMGICFQKLIPSF